MKRLVQGLGLVALAVIAAACSSGSGSTASPAGSGAPAPSAAAGGTVVVAKDLLFSPATITAPADEAFQILLDNQDSVPHNIAIKDAAGTFEFFCEVHPDMKGTLTAS